MKDNFDIRAYLTENKLTEATRGNDNRKHFGKTLINDNVILESIYDVDRDREAFYTWCQDTDTDPNSDGARAEFERNKDGYIDECDAAIKAEYEQYAAKYGEDKAKEIMAKFHPECNLDEGIGEEGWFEMNINNIKDKNLKRKFLQRAIEGSKDMDGLDITYEQANRVLDRLVDEVGEDLEIDLNEFIEELLNCYEEGTLNEVGYTDDEDDDYADDDFIGARGSNAELGIANDKRAAAAAKRGMVGTDLDADAPEDGPEFPDQPTDDAEGNDFQDPEDINDEPAAATAPGADVDPAKIFGKNAPYVEVLVDDLGQYLRGPKGKWRVNVSANLLRRAIDSVKAYMEEYEYPRKGFLLAPNKMGNYDEIPVLGPNTLNNTPKAVVYVHREPVNEPEA